MRHLVVDGYNAIHAWPALKRTLASGTLEDARSQLVGLLAAYRARRQVEVTVVFDSHGRAQADEAGELVDGVRVLFGSSRASADHVIERLVNEAARRGDAGDVVVATSDRLQRSLVAAMGCGSMSTLALEADVRQALGEVADDLARRSSHNAAARRVEEHLDAGVRARLEALRRGRRPAGPAGGRDSAS